MEHVVPIDQLWVASFSYEVISRFAPERLYVSRAVRTGWGAVFTAAETVAAYGGPVSFVEA